MARRELRKIEARQAEERAERPVYEITCADPVRAEEIRRAGFAVRELEGGQ